MSMSPCLCFSTSQCLHFSMSQCLLSPCLCDSMSPCLSVSVSQCFQCGQCQILLENEISIFKKLVSRRKHEVLQNFLVIQAVFFGVCVLTDLSSLLMKGTASVEQERQLRKLIGLRDWMMAVLAFPVGVFVVTMFWSLYLYDRDLVYPRLLDNFIPQWLNHGMAEHRNGVYDSNSPQLLAAQRRKQCPDSVTAKPPSAIKDTVGLRNSVRVFITEFGDDPFLFQHDCTPVTKASSIKTWMSEFGVEELDWPAQSPDLNPIEHLWDELERRLRATPSRPTSVPDLTNALLEERQEDDDDDDDDDEDEDIQSSQSSGVKSSVQHSVVEELEEKQLTESVIQPGTVVDGSQETDVFFRGTAPSLSYTHETRNLTPPLTHPEHTTVLPFIIIEMRTTHHLYPSRVCGLLAVCSFCVGYVLCVGLGAWRDVDVSHMSVYHNALGLTSDSPERDVL
ncbi:hypothetical protein QTP86_006505 [Hemibagrus guttatus]|nr:hypothetical protein QTP86_006505 [Hemibagrus guttatus]